MWQGCQLKLTQLTVIQDALLRLGCLLHPGLFTQQREHLLYHPEIEVPTVAFVIQYFLQHETHFNRVELLELNLPPVYALNNVLKLAGTELMGQRMLQLFDVHTVDVDVISFRLDDNTPDEAI